VAKYFQTLRSIEAGKKLFRQVGCEGGHGLLCWSRSLTASFHLQAVRHSYVIRFSRWLFVPSGLFASRWKGKVDEA
jgi:hypothetical protein